MKYVYPSIFTPVEDLSGYYFVQFPDIETAVTQGKNLDDARKMAIEILNLALIEMENDGEKIPTATDFKFFKVNNGAVVEEIQADTDNFRELLKIAPDYFIMKFGTAQIPTKNFSFTKMKMRKFAKNYASF